MNGIEKMREVFERVGSDISREDGPVIVNHAVHSIHKVTLSVEEVMNVWRPAHETKLSEALRALADLAEIGEGKVAEEELTNADIDELLGGEF